MEITGNRFNILFPNSAPLRLGERNIRFRVGSRILTFAQAAQVVGYSSTEFAEFGELLYQKFFSLGSQRLGGANPEFYFRQN